MLPISSVSGNYYSPGFSAISPVTNTNGRNSSNAISQQGEGECQTCSSRKYQDGSDELVSFKSPAHISPQSSAAVIRSHEQEHVSNAYKKAAMKNGQVVSASVSLRTEICPECGRSYVSGGTTNTQIKYYNEKNPYQKDLKLTDSIKYTGRDIDLAV